MHKRTKAQQLLNLAAELEQEGKQKEAIEVYLKSIEADPDWSVSYFDLALLYKYRNDWPNSLKYNQKALELDPADQSTCWNLGIAATALRDWATARFAWKSFGIPLPEGDPDAELQMKIGMTPIRLRENREVVWAERIDPARAIIQNVPTGASKRRFRDIILNDGAPNGTRRLNDHEYPVFDELELFEAGPYSTFSVWVKTGRPDALVQLEQIFESNDWGFENWTQSIRYLCRQCSEGTPHEHHDRNIEQTVAPDHNHLGLAATSEPKIRQVLLDWQQVYHSEVLEFEQLI